MPLRTARCSKRSALSGGRGVRRTGAGTRSTGSIAPVGSKSGTQTSSCWLEADGHLLADAHVGRLAADDVRRQVDRGSSARATLATT